MLPDHLLAAIEIGIGCPVEPDTITFAELAPATYCLFVHSNMFHQLERRTRAL
jgi:hypothetical protein